MWNLLWILLGIGLLFWMFKKGGCCGGMDKKSIKGGEKKMSEKVKDPVCGMDVDSETAVAKSEHMGKTFYFCSAGCKVKFDQEPMNYMKSEEKQKPTGGGCCG